MTLCTFFNQYLRREFFNAANEILGRKLPYANDNPFWCNSLMALALKDNAFTLYSADLITPNL